MLAQLVISSKTSNYLTKPHGRWIRTIGLLQIQCHVSILCILHMPIFNILFFMHDSVAPPPPPICRLHPYLSYHWCRTLNEQYLLSKVQCFLLFVLFFKCPPRGSRNKSTDSYVAWLLRTFSVVEKWWRSLTFELVWDIPHIHQLYHFIANKPFSDLFDLAK